MRSVSSDFLLVTWGVGLPAREVVWWPEAWLATPFGRKDATVDFFMNALGKQAAANEYLQVRETL
jgi:hypothetical protein